MPDFQPEEFTWDNRSKAKASPLSPRAAKRQNAESKRNKLDIPTYIFTVKSDPATYKKHEDQQITEEALKMLLRSRKGIKRSDTRCLRGGIATRTSFIFRWGRQTSRRTLKFETFFEKWKSFKNDEKCLSFHLKSSQDIQVFVLIFLPCWKTTWFSNDGINWLTNNLNTHIDQILKK